jgi:hypothetical protein
VVFCFCLLPGTTAILQYDMQYVNGRVVGRSCSSPLWRPRDGVQDRAADGGFAAAGSRRSVVYCAVV